MSGSGNPCWLQNCLALIRLKRQNTGLTWKEREIISFSPVAPNSIRVRSEQVGTVTPDIDPHTSSEKPSFGPTPDVESENFDFKAEIDCLPFKLNIGTTVEMTCEQQNWFINIIYDHPEVFSLHDEDLGFCNKIKHTIAMTSDRPVYLLHHTIPPQLLGEVHKCLDNWLRQGIIRPSQSPYASQVVIVQKSQGKFVCAWITENLIPSR